jgi:uncharacterized membrane protein
MINNLLGGLIAIVLGLLVLAAGIWAGRFYSQGGRDK